jgi:hypothetical protein
MASVYMRRRFTCGSFEYGGRLWDATQSARWYSMSSGDRLRLLRIDGEDVVSVDIHACALSTLYAITQSTLPEGDLYVPLGYSAEHRATFKLASLCALGRSRRLLEWPADALKDPKPGKRDRRPILSAEEAFTAFEAYHAPLRPHFYKTACHRLQRHESDALVKLLVTRPDLKALPLHDEIIVPFSRADEAADAFLQAFTEVAGGNFRVSINCTSGNSAPASWL